MMTETLVGVSPRIDRQEPEPSGRRRRRSWTPRGSWCGWPRERGVALTGPDGLLKAMTKTVIETALEEEMSRAPGLRQARRRRAATGATPATGSGPRRC